MTYPQPNSVTRRRELRQKIRNTLDVSRSDAPSMAQLVNAARQLNELMSLTTGGAYQIEVTDESVPFSIERSERLSQAIRDWREV